MSKKTRQESSKAGTAAKTVARTVATPRPASGKRKTAAAEAKRAPSSQRNPAALTEGDRLPDVRLPRDGGETITLSAYAGRRLVIFCYPRADTPGCTREAMDFSRLAPDFAALDTAVLGLSADPQRAQDKFRDKHDLRVPLLSDEAHDVLERLGAWGNKSMYGKTFQGVLRTTVLVGGDRRIAKVWRAVRVDGHAEAVLEYIRNL